MNRDEALKVIDEVSLYLQNEVRENWYKNHSDYKPVAKIWIVTFAAELKKRLGQ